jgi:threonine aldolase
MPGTQTLIQQCSNVLPGHGAFAVPMKAQLESLAISVDKSALADLYGEGEYLASFESEVAAMFGFEHGVFMPSGTMAQQIAMRIWCDRKQKPLIAMHPTAHLETAEQLGYQRLHGLHRVQFGVPELVSNRMLCIEDFKALSEYPAAVLLELPMRPLGGQLPEWAELLEIRSWCDEHQIALHLDGARIWSCRSFYNKSFAEIGALFDSIYVSFYKDLGGFCGCVLMGTKDFIAESRIWQRRHGGNLYTQFPFVASAKQGLDSRLPQIDAWVDRAKYLAGIMNRVDGVQTNPPTPHTNIFQLYLQVGLQVGLQGDLEILQTRHDELAQETGIFLFGRLSEAQIPGHGMAEVHCWENAMSFDESGLQDFLAKLVG